MKKIISLTKVSNRDTCWASCLLRIIEPNFDIEDPKFCFQLNDLQSIMAVHFNSNTLNSNEFLAHPAFRNSNGESFHLTLCAYGKFKEEKTIQTLTGIRREVDALGYIVSFDDGSHMHSIAINLLENQLFDPDLDYESRRLPSREELEAAIRKEIREKCYIKFFTFSVQNKV